MPDRSAEKGTVDDVFYRSAHPYTLGLKAAMPSNDPSLDHRLLPIEGSPPDLFDPPRGCAYAARCPYAMQLCSEQDPGAFYQGERHFARCWLHHPSAPEVAGLYHGEGPHDRAAEQEVRS